MVIAALAALFALPKDALGLLPVRPEDICGVVLIPMALLYMRVTRSEFADAVTWYLAYFGIIAFWDAAGGHPGALVFYGKECSYLALAALIGQSSDVRRIIPWLFIPGLVYIAYQLVTLEPRGFYGVAPLGHEQSPVSAGIWGLAAVMLGARLECAWLAEAGVVVTLFSGSKIAVLGLAVFLVIWMGLSRWIFGLIAAVVVLGILWHVDPVWGGLGRYVGFLHPWQVIASRGIWDKFDWLRTPWQWVVGTGYIPPHLRRDGSLSFGMAMDNQALYYLITGGFIGCLLAALLLLAIVKRADRIMLATVGSFIAMGLGAEVMQLSLSGNLFWLMVGLSL